MSALVVPPPLPPDRPAPPTWRTLRKLFLTVFVRGKSVRNIQRHGSPKTVTEKLLLALLTYSALGLIAIPFRQGSLFVLAIYLHASTFLFVGMFVASSASEVLFNRDEPDILLHRPIEPRAMLWAKFRVMIEVSLWLAGAFNFVGLLVGLSVAGGGWRFLPVHAASTILEAIFCTGCVVLVYQVCLRLFGRERLEGIMTMSQVILTIGMVGVSQLLPQIAMQAGGSFNFDRIPAWAAALPPAWFAGLDDALAGSGAQGSWTMGALAVLATGAVLALSVGKMAGDYEKGLRGMGEIPARARSRPRKRRWMETLVDLPPFRWWMRDPAARAAFLLTSAYLLRDRDLKLRLYPRVAPMVFMPWALLLTPRIAGSTTADSYLMVIAGGLLGLIPLVGLDQIQYSQQWQAADVFRVAPVSGPAGFCTGARRAILGLLTLPTLVLFCTVVWIVFSNVSNLALLIPGVLMLPVYAMLPSLGGRAVPFAEPSEVSRPTHDILRMLGVTIAASVLALLTTWALHDGWFWWFVAGHAVFVVAVYAILRAFLARARWPED